MGGGQNDLGIKANLCPNLWSQMPQHCARRFNGLEDAARQAQLGNQCIVPISAVRTYQCRGAGVGVLVGGNAAEQIIQIIRHHQKRLGSGQLLRVLFF